MLRTNCDVAEGSTRVDELSAVKNGLVIELDDDVASRWGPRIIEFLETIAAAVAAHDAQMDG